MCGVIIKTKPRQILKTLTLDAYNKILFFIVMESQAFGNHKSRIATASLDGSKRENLLSKDSSYITSMACDPYKKILYYTDSHQKSLNAIGYRQGVQNTPITIKQKENLITQPSGLTWYENQVFIVNLGSKEAIRCRLFGERECKAFNLNILNAQDILVDGVSRQPMNRNPCIMARCKGMCVQTEHSYECMCGDSIVTEAKTCDVRNDITSSVRLIQRENQTASASSHSGLVLTIILLLVGLLFAGLGYLVYSYRKKQGNRDFIRNLHFQNPLASFQTAENKSNGGTMRSGSSMGGTTTASFEVEREKLQISSSIQRLLRGSAPENDSEIGMETSKVS